MPYIAVAGTLLNGARGIWINKKLLIELRLSKNLSYGVLKQVRIHEL